MRRTIRSRAVLWLVTALVAVGLCPSARATAPAMHHLTVMLERVSPGPTHFHLTMTTRYGQAGGFLADVGIRLEDNKVSHVWPGFVSSTDQADNRTVNAPGADTSACDVTSD